jgi:hypothetical protein
MRTEAKLDALGLSLFLTVLFTGDGIKPPLARDHYAR